MNERKSIEMKDVYPDQHIISAILNLPSESISMSANIDKIAPAIIKATGDMGFVKKDKTAGEKGGKKIYYADINAVLEECKPKLMEHGLTMLQPMFMDEHGNHRMSTLLLHESGQFIHSSMRIEKNQADIQQFGKDITYIRRYACVSFLGIAQEDNDGFKQIPEKETRKLEVTKQEKLATDSQIETMMGYDKIQRDKILSYYKVKEFRFLTEHQAAQAIWTVWNKRDKPTQQDE